MPIFRSIHTRMQSIKITKTPKELIIERRGCTKPPSSVCFGTHTHTRPHAHPHTHSLAMAETFRANYLHGLRQLTFNSKPLIDSLTILAEQNQHYAAIVVDCIKDKIIRVNRFSVFYFQSLL